MFFDADDEAYDLAKTQEDMNVLLEDMGFDSRDHFRQETGVTAEELIGVPFLLIHKRVFLKDE